MFGWTSQQRNAAIASFLSWALDAFNFFILVFLLSELAQAFRQHGADFAGYGGGGRYSRHRDRGVGGICR
ncbi:hypothetical protein JJO56_13690 [Dickeya chrysanthemi]|nr:hypothetical protein [Dickeya chrysanthemi]